MKRSRKKYSYKRNRQKTKRQKLYRDYFIIPNSTPQPIRKIGKEISEEIPEGQIFYHKDNAISSYSPTINEELVSLKSIPRKKLYDCNNDDAFKMKKAIEISIPGYIYGHNCYKYYTPQSKQFLLNNLRADKHVDASKIVPPIQSQSNCWFNTMFVTFFISDKGRKFFHFFRQLMIEGKQKDGTNIPNKLKDAFALLNFGIDAALTGNRYAYELNTNNVISQIYNAIPNTYKVTNNYIVNTKEPGNPILYYIGIINYLNNNAILLMMLRDVNKTWKTSLEDTMKKVSHLPHIVVLEIFDENALSFNNKPITFTINHAKYKLDSAIVRDKTKSHFCALLTVEGKQMAYDGLSFHRLEYMEWKNKLNDKNFNWKFEGSTNYDGVSLIWNFTECYQMLIYYRV
jgi:hypothetical protein